MKPSVVIAAALLSTALPEITRGGIDYRDVAVVVNVNSDASTTIGSYFKSARSVPDVNMIYISAPTAEEIDSSMFESLRAQIQSYLTLNNLVNSINYIVTTKGVPLRVNRGSTISTSSPSSSVESELSCILGAYSSSIGKAGKVQSPYYYASTHFSHAAFGIYLVTRLDGYTVQDVLNLIDRSGPGTLIDQSAWFVLDQDPAWNSTIPYLNNYLTSAANKLRLKGKNVILNSDSVFVTQQTDVAGYTSWGSNDHYAAQFTQNAIPHNSYAAGAIAETYVSTSGRSFQSQPVYGQSLIADLIREGVSGAKGYVYEPYSSAMAVAFILFDRYTSGYNLAESFAMASAYLSWMGVVVGDPKTTIIFDQQNLVLPIQLDYLNVSSVQNGGGVQLSWGTLSEKDNYGFIVQRSESGGADFVDLSGSFIPGHGTSVLRHDYGWIDSNPAPTPAYYRLEQVDLDGTRHYTEAKHFSPRSDEEKSPLPERALLRQNFPNPFNPSTQIAYVLARPGRATIKVYDEVGREVATLADGFQEAGKHLVTFFGEAGAPGGISSLASGVYYYRLETDGQVLTKRMLYIK